MQENTGAKRRIRRGAGIVMMLCLAALAWLAGDYAVHRPYFSIRTIEIAGETDFIDCPALEKSLWESLRGNYFTADIDALRGVAEAVPWVSRASVERVWPDALRVTIVRRRAAALWGGTRLLSDRGEIFAPKEVKASEAQKLPRFSGPDPMAPQVVEMFGVLEPLARRLGADVEELSVTDRGAWSMKIEGGSVPETRIILGRETHDSSAGSRFALVVAHYGEVARMMGGPPAQIDARYVNAFAATMPDPAKIAAHEQKQAAAEAQAAQPKDAGKADGPAV
ncbi:FtsQ-type POTRA domain-containing protein [Mesosutterella sp. AGMB02718]|uniref:Cell division protein FtsQ n=1 Tax=Mesosutterella faecium TaxID=2925194 RepID=A0ABT7IJU0_9BURK|nr:FtsQ-type POTRA domain-containing protein [Mesosutterella sp. AGMB02718]MDL2058639.1 FtsQ-type POTRA domain-containing protein [Mesosutterella sp. AGMB02718]